MVINSPSHGFPPEDATRILPVVGVYVQAISFSPEGMEPSHAAMKMGASFQGYSSTIEKKQNLIDIYFGYPIFWMAQLPTKKLTSSLWFESRYGQIFQH